ncbi:MAG: SpoIIE family protein phosphatase [bacterium]|nr:SpoIIE family protein phosphatase [bacterium]
MFRRPTKEINAEFQAEEKYLDSIQRIVREVCTAAGMNRKYVSAVLLAIEEGATNIIRHAYLYEKGSIRLRIVTYKKLISFSLIDTGRSFRPEGTGKLDLNRLVESGRRGGLGFYMIQKIMDSVEYVSSAGQNELRMTKWLGAEAGSATPPLLRRMFTLRAKFSFWTLVIVSILIGTAYYFINDRSSREVYNYLDGTVAALGKTLAEQAGLYIINRRSDVEFDELVISYYTSNPVLKRIVLTDSSNVILAHSDDIHNIRRPYQYPPEADPGFQSAPQRWRIENRETNYLILPIRAGNRELGSAYLTYSSELVQQRLQLAKEKILQFTGLLLVIGIVGIYLLSNYFVKPIVAITRRVRRFSSGDLESELPLEGAAEFFEISSALNEMMTRLRRDRESAIERERMAKEIEVASQIQKTLLPVRLPHLPGLEIDAFYRAASMIGGDLYDIFDIGGSRCCLVVADVSGKGVPASLVMSMLRTVIRIFAQGSASARDTLLSVNDYLSGNMPRGMFVTVLMAIFDSSTRKLDFVSAGHNPLLLYKAATRKVVKLNPSGMPLGVPVTLAKDFGDSLESFDLQLDEGDLFFIYTDGITEAVDREGNQYGLERMIDFLQGWQEADRKSELKALSKEIIDRVDSFSGFAAQRDDITFVVGRTVAVKEDREDDEELDEQTLDSRTLPESGTGEEGSF